MFTGGGDIDRQGVGESWGYNKVPLDPHRVCRLLGKAGFAIIISAGWLCLGGLGSYFASNTAHPSFRPFIPIFPYTVRFGPIRLAVFREKRIGCGFQC